jgi:hypothetical protein
MKLLTKARKHPEIAFFILCYAAFMLFIIGNIFPKYLAWHALPTPPEPIEKLFYVLGNGIVVTTTSGNRFSCNIDDLTECWVVDRYHREEGVSQCGEDIMSLKHEVLSTQRTVQSAQSCGFAHNYANSVTAYALNDDGLVYVKQIGWVTISGYYTGAVLSTIGTVLFYFGRNAILDAHFTLQIPKE